MFNATEDHKVVRWYVYLIVLLAVLLLVIFVPRPESEGQTISVGSVWEDADLVASQDIPLMDSVARLRRLVQEGSSNVPPVYRKEKSIASNALGRLNTVWEDLKDQDSSGVYNDGLRSGLVSYIESLYRGGLVAELPSGSEIIVMDIKEARYVPRNSVQTLPLKTADLPTQWNSQDRNDLAQLLEGVLEPDLVLDPDLRKEYINDRALGQLLSSKTLKGDVIIANGELVDEDAKRKIEQYNLAIGGGGTRYALDFWRFLGYVILFVLIMSVFVLYIRNHDYAILEQPSRTIFMVLWPVLFAMFTYFVERSGDLSAYLIPYCIVPILVRSFTHTRLALFAHVVVILIASIISRLGYEFTFLQILAGIVAVLFVKETRDWTEFFRSLLFILVSYCLGYFGVTLILDGNVLELDWRMYGWFLLNVVLLLLAYPLIPLLERIFGFTTTIRLNELADFNQPLLKELSITAPGTFQHSLQVSNLCQAAAEVIGANVDLIKVGALYHDIGKMKEPRCFIENQSGDSPHDNWSNFESARQIIGHVTEGVKMAQAAKLPPEIIEFIQTHHGDTRVEYFYRKQLSEQPDREFDETLFRYPGPRPSTKEQTILMMADSLEAASKSLKSPTGQDIDQLVDKIIKGKISHGQLDDSPLTFEDLHRCEEVFKKMLRSINHVRIEYPPSQSEE